MSTNNLTPITIDQYNQIKSIDLQDYIQVTCYGKPYEGSMCIPMLKTATTYKIDSWFVDTTMYNFNWAFVKDVLTKNGFVQGTHWVVHAGTIKFKRIQA